MTRPVSKLCSMLCISILVLFSMLGSAPSAFAKEKVEAVPSDSLVQKNAPDSPPALQSQDRDKGGPDQPTVRLGDICYARSGNGGNLAKNFQGMWIKPGNRLLCSQKTSNPAPIRVTDNQCRIENTVKRFGGNKYRVVGDYCTNNPNVPDED